MSRPLTQEQLSVRDQTTSMIWIDLNGDARQATGEFANFLSEGEKTEPIDRFLADASCKASRDQRDGETSSAALKRRWGDHGGAPIEIAMADGTTRLLTSCAHPDGGTIYLSVNTHERIATAEPAREIAENAGVILWANDADGRIIYANLAARNFAGGSDGDGEGLAQLIASRNCNAELFSELQQTGKIADRVVRANADRDTETWLSVNLTLVNHASGLLVYGAAQDITQHKQAEEQIRRGRELLGDAIESLSEGFALYDEEARLVMFNERYRQMNSAAEDILAPGLRWEILMRTLARRGAYADAIGREEQWVSERLAAGVEHIQEFELNQTDGGRYLVSVHPTKLGGFVVTRTDVTAMKQAEEAERESDMLVRKVLDTCSAVVVMARIGDGRVLYRSPAAVELFGQQRNAVDHYLSPTDRADYVTEMLVDGRVDDYRIEQINGRGEIFPAKLSGRIAEYRGEEVLVTHITDLTEQFETEAMIRKVLEACPVPVQMTNAKNGNLLFRSPETIALFGDVRNARNYYANPDERAAYVRVLMEKGKVDNRRVELVDARGRRFWGAISARVIEFNGEQVIVSNTRDLTDELAVQEELASQREMLFQNEKMSALGELLAGVAHELNNPLSVVVGHALMLREEVSDPQVIKRIEKISSSAERCAKIVKTFLAMARQRPAKMERLDFEAIVSTAADVAAFGVANVEIEIRKKLADDLPDTYADPDQITQVLINLIINAEQAMAKSRKGDWIEICTRMNSRRQVLEICISDNGPGIPESLRPRIFEPFFTTKDVGEGTGIGLAFCHRIMHSHGGGIWLDSDYLDGSRFVLSLPVRTGIADAAASTGESGEGEETARVLVVDDEVEVADLIADILRRDGCTVMHANSGKEAVDLMRSNEFNVVLSDLNMPELDGRGFFEILRSEFPKMAGAIAFITGDAMGPASQSLLREAGCPFLEKPVSPAELRGLVQSLLRSNKRAMH